ncbi:nucleolin isoform X2 [Lutzomyia longipalpis]|uniref:Putative histone deacetylase hdt1 n=2 Tax=Lutzomyia longipalpis TaxID=7200 RepID=A0A1B0CY77_LUTLO|nr:nucleolin isoform X2 [Lutzomyia longipalpis]
MRNRTELKTTTIEGSDYEEEVSDAEDSGEDWQPEKDGDGAVAGKKKGAKVAPAKKGTPAKRKAPAAKPKGGKKKAKKESSDDDDDDEDDVEDDSDEEFPSDSEDSGEEVKNGDGTKKKRPAKKEGGDPGGIFTLYVKKMDLKNGLNEQQKLFMWKRDGSSLLQRFKQNETDDKNDYIFTPTTVYSCWEDRRREEYFEVKTKSTSGGDGLVTIVDKEEFAKFIEQSKTYEKPESEDENEEEGEGGENSEDEEEGEEDDSNEEES